jgi:hypothetical protein
MAQRSAVVLVVLVVIACLSGGCSENAPEVPADAGAAPQTDSSELKLPPARTLALPGKTPPAGTAAPAGRNQPLVWEVPAGWVEVEPASSMRLAQYRIDGPGGSGECAVFYFGPGQGGDAMSNATRWASQFAQVDGRPSTEVMRYSELEGSRVPVNIVEVTGIYNGGLSMTGEAPQEVTGHMLLGGIAEGPDANWFFKFTGPEATVQAERNAFLDMMKSIGGSG